MTSPPTIRIARPGPGKGWRQTKRSGRPELGADGAHLVLEQLAQRLDQVEVEVLRQPADVVVGLDRRRAVARRRPTRSRPSRAFPGRGSSASVELRRLLLEHADELLADDPALLLRVDDAGEAREEALARRRRGRAAPGSGRGTSRPPARPRSCASGRGRRSTQVSRSPSARCDQRRGGRRVDAAREAADRAAVADLRADRARPARRSIEAGDQRSLAAADVAQEALRGSRCRTACGRPRGGTGSRRGRARRLERGDRRAGAGGQRDEARRRLEDRVAVAHPALCSARQAGQQPAALARRAARCGRTPPPRRPRPGRRAPAPSPASRNRCPAPGRRARAARAAAAARPRRRPRPGRPESTSAARRRSRSSSSGRRAAAARRRRRTRGCAARSAASTGRRSRAPAPPPGARRVCGAHCADAEVDAASSR